MDSLDQNKIMQAINSIEDIAREPFLSKVRAKQEGLEPGDSIEQAARELLDDLNDTKWIAECRNILEKSLISPQNYCVQLATSLSGFIFSKQIGGNYCHAKILLNGNMVTVSRYDWDELIVALETLIEFK